MPLEEVIITPDALPMFYEEPRNLKKMEEKIRKDSKLTKKPHPPLLGPTKGGT